MPRAGEGKSPGRWITAVVLTVGLHYLWEMAQAPFFADFAGPSFWAHALRCLRASLGDLLITGVAYGITAALFHRPDWPFVAKWRGPAMLWVLLGVLLTVLIERWAVSVGRWTYGPAMLIVFGLGLLPLLQWLIVPTVTLVILRTIRGSAAKVIG